MLKQIIRYLKGIKTVMLCYQGDDLTVQEGTDTSFSDDLDDSKPISGYIFLLGGGAVSCSSKKQNSVAKTIMKFEYVVSSAAASGAICIRRLLLNLGIIPSAKNPITSNVDNMSAIFLAKNLESHKKLKHIARECHFVCETIKDKEVVISYIPSQEMATDPMTKPFPREIFHCT